MASLQELKRRIKAVTSTRQITKAMELVSATKMRKSQEVALLSRPYALEALRLLGELTHREVKIPDLMQTREVKKRCIVIISSDRGLAGSFNTNVFRSFEKWSEQERGRNGEDIFIAVGKKSKEYLERRGAVIARSFVEVGDHTELSEAEPLAEFLITGYASASWDEVIVFATHFRTTLKQEVMIRRVLPVNPDVVRRTVRELVPEYGKFSSHRDDEFGSLTFSEVLDFEYLIEPSSQAVLDALAPKLMRIVLYDILLEANASEHSARMVAMKNASENAGDLKEELGIELNKSRQANITRELAEIVSGAEALQN